MLAHHLINRLAVIVGYCDLLIGESNKAEGCELLGEFEFTGFRIGYRGEVHIQVTFEIDSNGIVNVSATDVETGQKTSTTIGLSSGLSADELKQAIDHNAEMELAHGGPRGA